MTRYKPSRLTINRIIQRALIVMLVTASALSSAAVLLEARTEQQLEQGKPIERELAGGQQHSYQITLAEGQYASVVVEQRGIDVAVELQTTDGKIIASFNNEYRNQGEEKIEMVAEALSYRLIVKASLINAPTAQYRIRVGEIRAATKDDRSMHEARKLEADYRRALQAGK